MALDNFANLKASIVSYSGRDDLSPNMDDFIALAEEQMYSNNGSELRLMTFSTKVTLTTTAGDNFLALPSDYMEAQSIAIVSSGETTDLIYHSPPALRLRSGTGTPQFYSITDTLIFDISPDDIYDIELTYYAKPTALSSANPTNYVLTNFPSIYLFGALAQVYDFTDDLQNSEAFARKFILRVRAAVKGDSKARIGTVAQAQVRGSTP